MLTLLVAGLVCVQVKSTYVASPLASPGFALRFAVLMQNTPPQVWEGKVQQDSEVLLIIKTRQVRAASVHCVFRALLPSHARAHARESVEQELVPAIQALVKEAHPHQVPEVIAVNVEQGLPEYLQWVFSSTGRPLQVSQLPLLTALLCPGGILF